MDRANSSTPDGSAWRWKELCRARCGRFAGVMGASQGSDPVYRLTAIRRNSQRGEGNQRVQDSSIWEG